MAAKEFDRIPPHDAAAEQAVLGSLILDPQVFSRVEDRLQPDDFYLPAHMILYTAIQELVAAGSPIDVITINSWLQDRNQLEDVGGVVYLAELAGAVPTAANADYYAKCVAGKAAQRRLIATATEVVQLGYEAADDIPQLLDAAESKISNLSKRWVRGGLVPLRDVLTISYADIEAAHTDPSRSSGTPTGFIDLDELVAGLKGSDLWILAARPSMGKTALALNLAQNMAIRTAKTVAIFTLEMSAPQLALRMLSAEGSIDAQVFRTGQLGDTDWEKLALAIGVLSTAEIFIDDTPGMTIFDMRAKLRRLQARQPVHLVVIDYLQLITGRGRDNRQQEISEISRSLKLMAREFHVPVLALSQLSRAVEQRQDKHPLLSDLRESGSIEQDADVVAFLYREDYYDPETEKKNIVEIIISKQRNGPTGKVELLFLKNYNKFLSLEASR